MRAVGPVVAVALVLVAFFAGLLIMNQMHTHAQGLEDAYRYWQQTGVITEDCLLRYPDMARDYARRQEHPETYSEYAAYVNDTPQPLPFVEWLRLEHYR